MMKPTRMRRATGKASWSFMDCNCWRCNSTNKPIAIRIIPTNWNKLIIAHFQCQCNAKSAGCSIIALAGKKSKCLTLDIGFSNWISHKGWILLLKWVFNAQTTSVCQIQSKKYCIKLINIKVKYYFIKLLKLVKIKQSNNVILLNKKSNFNYSLLILILSLPQPVKFPGWKVHTYTPANNTFDCPMTKMYFQYCALWQKSFHVLMRRRKKP